VTEGADMRGLTAAPAAATAGVLLRDAREAAGISLDSVAQQLKLHLRQVKALEDDDFAQLPGRTFIRGFIRNYARLLRLDPAVVLAALPDAGAGQSPEGASLGPSARPMGELPPDSPVRRSWARWAIPLLMVVAVAVAAFYERMRPPEDTVKRVAPEKVVPLPAPAPVTAPADTTALPNPLALPADKTDAPPGSPPERLDAGNAPATSMPPTTPQSAPPTGQHTPPVASEGTIALSFLGKSWVEVREAGGGIVLSTTGYAGGTQSASGRLPLDVVVGNASAVTVTFQGQPLDIAPFTSKNIAKFTLK
jgi:cytoskeleton protein RodZ